MSAAMDIVMVLHWKARPEDITEQDFIDIEAAVQTANAWSGPRFLWAGADDAAGILLAADAAAAATRLDTE